MRIILGLFIATWIIYQSQAKRDFTIVLDDLAFNITGPKIVKFVNSSIPTTKTFSVAFLVHRTLRDVNVKLSMSVIKRKNNPLNLLNININGCKGVAAQKVQYIRQIFQQLMRISNLPLKDCIFQPDTLYYIRNYTIVDDDYPPFLFISMWKFVWEMNSGKNPVAIATLTGRVEKTSQIN